MGGSHGLMMAAKRNRRNKNAHKSTSRVAVGVPVGVAVVVVVVVGVAVVVVGAVGVAVAVVGAVVGGVAVGVPVGVAVVVVVVVGELLTMESCPTCDLEIEGHGCCPDCDCWVNTERVLPVLPQVGDRLGEGFSMVSGDYEDVGGLYVDLDQYEPWEDEG